MGFDGLFTKTFYETFVVDFLVGRVLVDDKKSVFELYKPVGVENLSDQLMTAAGLRSQEFSSNSSSCCGLNWLPVSVAFATLPDTPSLSAFPIFSVDPVDTPAVSDDLF